jgi:hypothetical protein
LSVRFTLPVCLSLLAVVGVLVPRAPAAAQAAVLSGRALDGDDRPVQGLEVMLHRVTADGGATIARDTTEADGRFALSADGAAGDPVYFVAARHEGQLQIGPMLRAPFPESGYVLRIGAGPAGPAARDPRKAGIVVGILAVLGLAVAWLVRPPRRRRLLLRLAEIEEARAAGGDPSGDARERGRILTQLRRAAGS